MSNAKTIKIDGQIIEFNHGDTILDVANKANIYIPTLCYIEGLEAYGGCRLCLVKVLGDRKPYQTACSSPARNGMEVITKDDELQEIRRGILQMLLSEHPNSCLICAHSDKCEKLRDSRDKAGRVFGCFTCSNKDDCELRDIVEYLGIEELEYDLDYRDLPLERDDPFFERDYNLCILCGRCVRICNELRGASAINFMNRGKATKISTGGDLLHLNSDCLFCGACVDVCPTGALTPKNTKWVVKNSSTKSHCGFCSIGCGFDYFDTKGKLMESVPDDNSFNSGQGCVLGRFCTVQFNNAIERIKDPHVRKEPHGLVPVSDWNSVLGKVKEGFNNYNSEEIAFLASADLNSESAFLLKEIAEKVFKTKNIATMTNGEPVDILFNKVKEHSGHYSKIQDSEKVILLNANIQQTHPVLLINLKKAKDNGAEIVSISSLGSQLPRVTSRLVDNELLINPESLNETVISELTGESTTILIGTPYSTDILDTVLDANANVILLRNKSNINGVFDLIRSTESDILSKINNGEIKALYTTERIDKNIAEKLDFLVVQDIFPSDTSRLADIVLPAASFVESNGTVINNEFKKLIQASQIKKSINAKEDWEILMELSKAMDKPLAYQDLASITNELGTAQSEQSTKATDQSKLRGKGYTELLPEFRGEVIEDHVPELQKLRQFRKTGTIKSEEQKIPLEKRFEILECDEIAPNMYKMVFTAPLIAKKSKAGNFIILMKNETSERIPITLSEWDEDQGTVTIYFQERGYSTKELALSKSGEYLFSVVGPLGNEINIQNWGTVLLGGGCYGQGAILPVARAAKEAGNKVIVLLEGKTRYNLYLLDECQEIADELILVTADGSVGLTGTACGKSATGVKNILESESIDWAFFVGCKVMMAEASEETLKYKVPTRVALNTIMLDGTGMCGACRLTLKVEGQEITKFACVDGPVFDGHQVDWDELINRADQLDIKETEVYRGNVCRALQQHESEAEEGK